MQSEGQTHTRRAPEGGVAEPLRIWLLGGFRAAVGAREVGADLRRRRKAGSLVKLLALAPGHALRREGITDLLWPGMDARSAANNLHGALHAARRALDPSGAAPEQYLTLREDLVELRPRGRMWVDVAVFEEAAVTARRTGEAAAYRAAIDLGAGELLPEDRYEAWVEERRAELSRARHGLLIELSAIHEERQEYGAAAETLELAVAEEPVDETTHLKLMRMYAADGRRDEAMLRYEQLRWMLSERLGAQPTRASRDLYEAIRRGEHSVPLRVTDRSPVVSAPASNLPVQLTSFVGREDELVGVRRALAMTSLLTLTGTGGSGKTRLALEVAGDLVGAYPDGVWMVEFAPLSDPALVPRAVAAALGVRERPDRPLFETLADHLCPRQTLLVLDNCEHLKRASATLLEELLGTCPRLGVLATSREPLGVPEELVWPVSTLSLPDPGAEASVESALGTGAVRLFVDRARSRLPDFRLTAENAGAVAEVCRKLDGIPLAIELSTARMTALAVGQVAQRLEGSLDLLTGGGRTVARRHQTLRATLDWSHDLLDEQEKVLFRRLSVFAGGWTPAAARVVGAAGDVAGDDVAGYDVLDLLSRLVDKSLVVADREDGGAWYRMLEPVRQYAREKLEESGEADGVRQRHATLYFELARAVEPWLRGARRETWLGRLEREYGNLRSALSWASEKGERELAIWFGAALAEFWYISGNLSEGRRWLEAGMENNHDVSPARARALARAGWIAWEQGDYPGCTSLSERSLALSRELGDEAGVVTALSTLGWVAMLQRDLERAEMLGEEAVSLARKLDDTGGIARALLVLGLTAVCAAEYDRGLKVHEESLKLAREAGDSLAAAVSLVMGAFASLGRGDGERAEALCGVGLRLSPRPMVMNATAFQLSASAALASSRGLARRSARLWGAAASLREDIGASISPVEAHVYGPYIDAARAALDDAAWGEAWATGESMSVEEAVDYALTEESPDRPDGRRGRNDPPDPGEDGTLTARQREVVALVARGLTNRQIAAELGISPNTVANHVAGIMEKLDLHSRSAVAAWFTATWGGEGL